MVLEKWPAVRRDLFLGPAASNNVLILATRRNPARRADRLKRETRTMSFRSALVYRGRATMASLSCAGCIKMRSCAKDCRSSRCRESTDSPLRDPAGADHRTNNLSVPVKSINSRDRRWTLVFAIDRDRSYVINADKYERKWDE